MTAEEFREKQDFEYEHFLELTDSGNKPDYYNIEQFAENYHQAKLKLLGIANVSNSLPPAEEVYDNCDTMHFEDFKEWYEGYEQ